MPKICDHQDRYVCVNDRRGEGYVHKSEIPSRRVMKINSSCEEAHDWIITGDNEIIFSIVFNDKEYKIFPHFGDVQDGQRLVIGCDVTDHHNRKFTKKPLHCGGFHFISIVDPTLYIGVVDDHWALTKTPYTWFLTYPISTP